METKIKALSLVFKKNNQLLGFIENELLEIVIPRGNLMDALLHGFVLDNFGNENLDTDTLPYIKIEKKNILEHQIASYRSRMLRPVYLFQTNREDIQVPFEDIVNLEIKFDAVKQETCYQFQFDNGFYVKPVLTYERIVTAPRHLFIEYKDNKTKTTHYLLDQLVDWYKVNLYEAMPINQ